MFGHRTNPLLFRSDNALSPVVWALVLICVVCSNEGRAASMSSTTSHVKKIDHKKKQKTSLLSIKKQKIFVKLLHMQMKQFLSKGRGLVIQFCLLPQGSIVQYKFSVIVWIN